MTAREALRRGLLSLPLTRCVASFRGGNMQSVQVGWMKKRAGPNGFQRVPEVLNGFRSAQRFPEVLEGYQKLF